MGGATVSVAVVASRTEAELIGRHGGLDGSWPARVGWCAPGRQVAGPLGRAPDAEELAAAHDEVGRLDQQPQYGAHSAAGW